MYQNLKQNEAQSACAESTNKGLKDITQTQQQRSNLPTAVLTWHANTYKGHKLHQRCILCDARLVF